MAWGSRRPTGAHLDRIFPRPLGHRQSEQALHRSTSAQVKLCTGQALRRSSSAQVAYALHRLQPMQSERNLRARRFPQPELEADLGQYRAQSPSTCSSRAHWTGSGHIGRAQGTLDRLRAHLRPARTPHHLGWQRQRCSRQGPLSRSRDDLDHCPHLPEGFDEALARSVR
jgi:hypothetical protein